MTSPALKNCVFRPRPVRGDFGSPLATTLRSPEKGLSKRDQGKGIKKGEKKGTASKRDQGKGTKEKGPGKGIKKGEKKGQQVKGTKEKGPRKRDCKRGLKKEKKKDSK